jgi:hypothetical protein
MKPKKKARMRWHIWMIQSNDGDMEAGFGLYKEKDE